MIQTIIKRDGSKQEFSPSKLNGWGEWASSNLGSDVDWSYVVTHTVSVLPKECSSKMLQEQLIKTCLEQDSWSYNRMAGRLFASLTYKTLYGESIPSIKEVHSSLQKAGLMVALDYSDEDYEKLEKIIDHKIDLTYAHYQIDHIRNKYALKNRTNKKEYESPQFVMMRMAMALAEDEPVETRLGEVKEWYEQFAGNAINCPTPNYVNLGTPLKGYASCAVYTAADDAKSLAIGDHIAYTMTCMSAGIGSHINTRSVGDPVRGGVIQHQGKLPYYRSLVAGTHANLQAGRGGASTIHYPLFDPEVETIARLKNPMSTEDKKIRGADYSMQSNKFIARKVAKNEDMFMFTSYTAPDLYEAFYSGDEKLFEELYEKYLNKKSFKKQWLKPRDVVLTVLNEGYETGRAYLHFPDEANRHTPFKETIYSSNLCVAPETRILTKEGYQVISELEDEKVDIWNGREWSEVFVRKTGEGQKLLRVVTNSGQELECTPYHKFYVAIRDANLKTTVKMKRAHELEKGDKLIKFNLPVIEGEEVLEYPYDNGFYSGDGCLVPNGKRVYLYHEKRKLKPFLSDIYKNWCIQEDQNREYGASDLLRDKFFVPTEKFTVESRIKWFEGLMDADGCVARNGKTQSLQISSTQGGFLQDVQMMLQTLGVLSKVVKGVDAGYQLMPANDGTGEMKEYYCKATKRLLIGQSDIIKLQDLGFSPNRLVLTGHIPNRECTHFIKIEEVVDEGRVDDTYCFTEPKRGMGMFNGLLTGNCQEISLPTKPYFDMKDLYSDNPEASGEIALCSLAAINVAKVTTDAQYEKAAYYALKMIDKVIHMGDYVFPHLEITAKSRMSAGVGIVGLAHYMAKNKLSYKSQEGKKEMHRIAERHAYYLIKASLKLGKEKGNAPWMHKTKWPDGWLPIDTYNKNVDGVVPNDLQYDWETLRQEIIENGGIRNSVVSAIMPSESSSKATGTTNAIYPIRDLTLLKTDGNYVINWCAPDGDKLAKWYESAWDIPSKDMIDCYAIFQKFIDQGISGDLFRKIVGDDFVTSKEMLTDYLYMVKMGLKSRYYQNSLTSVGTDLVENGSDEGECESCKL